MTLVEELIMLALRIDEQRQQIIIADEAGRKYALVSLRVIGSRTEDPGLILAVRGS